MGILERLGIRKSRQFLPGPGRLDALALTGRENRADAEPGRDYYCISADKLYPRTLDYMLQLKREEEIAPFYIRTYAISLLAFSQEDIGIAYEAIRPGMIGEELTRRAEILELARLIFTAVLRHQNAGPIGLHILKAPGNRWRLSS